MRPFAILPLRFFAFKFIFTAETRKEFAENRKGRIELEKYENKIFVPYVPMWFKKLEKLTTEARRAQRNTE